MAQTSSSRLMVSGPAHRSPRLAADALGQYFERIGQHDLLTPQEEVELAQAIEMGNEARARLGSGGRKTRAVKRELLGAIRRADQAREMMLTANLRLVVAVARRYRNTPGLDLVDLVQEGNLGLIHALGKFDWRKGFKFSTYATWWIRQSISRAVAEKAGTIRLPVHLNATVATVRVTEAYLEASLGRKPTLSETARHAGLSEHAVRRALEVSQPVSIDQPVGEDGSILGDFVQDGNAADPSLEAELHDVSRRLRAAIDQLPERKRRILTLRYGFFDGVPRRLDQIAEEFSLSVERISQIEKEALTNLRSPALGLEEADFRG